MRPILALAFLRTLRLLLPLAACSWGPAVAYPVWSSSDDLVHLYTSSGTKAFYLQISPDGRVSGTPSQTIYSTLVIKPISAGLVRIIGALSELSLCMRNDGSLFGSTSFISEDCVFKHTLAETRYDVYESVRHKFLISLGNVKGTFGPNQNLPRFSQFLTRRNEIPLSQFRIPLPVPQPVVPREKANDSCRGILAGRIPEEVPLVNGTHPCLIEEEEYRDPFGTTLDRRIPSPRTSS